jgi:hypothetical protein
MHAVGLICFLILAVCIAIEEIARDWREFKDWRGRHD